MEQTLNNVHVVIYGHDMLREAVNRISREHFEVEPDYYREYDCGNDCLVFERGQFRLLACPVKHPVEVSLNQLVEIIVGGQDDRA